MTQKNPPSEWCCVFTWVGKNAAKPWTWLAGAGRRSSSHGSVRIILKNLVVRKISTITRAKQTRGKTSSTSGHLPLEADLRGLPLKF